MLGWLPQTGLRCYYVGGDFATGVWRPGGIIRNEIRRFDIEGLRYFDFYHFVNNNSMVHSQRF